MEINAMVYAIAGNEELLRRVHETLGEKTFQQYYSIETMEPCAVLPLTQTWYTFSERAEPTDGPDGWMDCLRECGRTLGKNGAVVVVYRSLDHPDSYQEYAYTTPSGGAGHSESLVAINSYARAMGHGDISLALYELFSERTARERAYASRRIEKKEALRRERGDFEITGDGILKKYRGHDIHVTIPDGVKEIADDAFMDRRGVERMILEDEEYDAPEMETLKIPDSVEKIGSYAFAYCTNLKKVEMADHVRSIGCRAFEGCENLQKLRLSNGLTEIEEYAFFMCDSLRTVYIPEGVTRIGTGAFLYCDSLKTVTLPKSMKSIGDEAFRETALEDVFVPDGVTEIGQRAFPEGCCTDTRKPGQEPKKSAGIL